MYIKVRVINRMRQRYEFCLLTCTTIGEKFFRRQREESADRAGKSGRGIRKTIPLGWRLSFWEGLGRFSGGIEGFSGGGIKKIPARISPCRDSLGIQSRISINSCIAVATCCQIRFLILFYIRYGTIVTNLAFTYELDIAFRS